MRGFGVARDASAGPLSEREWMWVDNRIHWWLQEEMTALRLMNVKKIGEGKMSHEFSRYEHDGRPIFTYTFEEEALAKQVKVPTRKNLIGIRMDIELSKLEMDASGNYQSIALDGAMRQFQRYVDRAVYRGYDVKDKNLKQGTGAIAPAVQGLCTYTGINDATDVGGDGGDDLTAAGDVPSAAKDQMAELITDHHYGPYTLCITRSVYLQAMDNEDSNTGLTDLDRLWRIPLSQGIIEPGRRVPSAISKIVTTPNLLNADETSSNGFMLMVDPKPEYMDLLVNYEPTRINLFNGGLTNRLTQQFALITGLSTRMIRPTAACKSDDLTTNFFA